MVEATDPKKITVVDYTAGVGNKRTEIADEDVLQAINDLTTWLKSKGYKEMKDGCDASGLACHKHLHLLLSKHNGGLHLQESYVTMEMDQIQAKNQELNGEFWPFAKDIDSNLMALKQDGQVVVLDCDDMSVSEELKMTLGQVLEDTRDKALTGKYLYEAGVGLMAVA